MALSIQSVRFPWASWLLMTLMMGLFVILMGILICLPILFFPELPWWGTGIVLAISAVFMVLALSVYRNCNWVRNATTGGRFDFQPDESGGFLVRRSQPWWPTIEWRLPLEADLRIERRALWGGRVGTIFVLVLTDEQRIIPARLGVFWSGTHQKELGNRAAAAAQQVQQDLSSLGLQRRTPKSGAPTPPPPGLQLPDWVQPLCSQAQGVLQSAKIDCHQCRDIVRFWWAQDRVKERGCESDAPGVLRLSNQWEVFQKEYDADVNRTHTREIQEVHPHRLAFYDYLDAMGFGCGEEARRVFPNFRTEAPCPMCGSTWFLEASHPRSGELYPVSSSMKRVGRLPEHLQRVFFPEKD